MRKLFRMGEKSPQLEQVIHLHLSALQLDNLSQIANAQQCSVEDVVFDMLNNGIDDYFAGMALMSLWEKLTPRQQQVTALACLNYANAEIASKLTISINTVKTHIGNVLKTFDASSKEDLRRKLVNWDFQEWLQEVGLGR